MSQSMYETGLYLEKNQTWHVEDSSWKATQIIKIISRNYLEISSVCEIGCGSGEILNQLYMQMASNINYIGYEISPQAFELCQTRKKERLDFKLENIFDEPQTFFDLVLCIDVFEHIENYFSFLRKIKPIGKYKVFHIPLDISVSSVLRSSPILYARSQVGHIHYFTKEIALEVLKDTGYEILDFFYTPGSIQLKANLFKTFLARIPRQFLFALNQDLAVRFMGGYSLIVLAK